MPHPYPFHTYSTPRFERRPTWTQKPAFRQPIVRMPFIAALIWTLCIALASVI